MKIRKETGKELALDFLYDIVGGGIFAIGTHCFVSPSNIAPGGASGIATMCIRDRICILVALRLLYHERKARMV